MPRHNRAGLRIAGLLAAVALAARGVLDWHSGQGWALLLVAAALVTAVLLRHFLYRDR